MDSPQTIIIGAGLAGLACAAQLTRSGQSCLLIEATDRIGGRVRTDHVAGFTLDHGFQVLLTRYPACRELLDYSSLDLRAFEPGALIRQRGAFRVLSDPWRRPLQTWATATNPVGTIADKLRIAKLRRDSRRGSLQDLYQRPQTTTLERLRNDGFSEKIIHDFFRPFLGGVFLDESLSTPSRMLEFVFRMFAEGDIAVPARGMAEIPRQLADSLPRGTLRLQTCVERIEHTPPSESNTAPVQRVVLQNETLSCRKIVIATPSDTAAKLLGRPALATKWSGTTNLYFSAERSPDPRRLLMLCGDEQGPVQSVTVLSDIAPSYAPKNRSLISVSVDASHEPPDGLDNADLEKRVREHLTRWFADDVRSWQLIRIYRIPYSLPVLTLDPVLSDLTTTVGENDGVNDGVNEPNADGILIAGDHRETSSIEGAMNSGLRVADRILGRTKSH